MLLGAAQAADFEKGLAAFGSGDYSTALREWKPLAEQGYPGAQSNLGFMYDKGLGVTQDYAEAVKWYSKAAAQGHAPAQNNLGTMYDKGLGVIQDNETAHMWFNISSARGDKQGAENRDIIAKRMTPVAIEEAQRRAKRCMKSNYKNCD